MMSSICTRARAASTRLGITWLIDDEWRPQISVEETTSTDRRKIFKFLRQAYRSDKTARLAAVRYQGKNFHCFPLSKTSSHFHREGNFTRFAEWRFIHRAHLADVSLNMYNFRRAYAERLCRRCHKQVETVPHVLNHCLQYIPAVTRRHNNIVSRIKKAAVVDGRSCRRTNPLALKGSGLTWFSGRTMTS